MREAWNRFGASVSKQCFRGRLPGNQYPAESSVDAVRRWARPSAGFCHGRWPPAGAVAVVLCLGLWGGCAQAASLQNGDFSNGFSAWDGEIFDATAGNLLPVEPDTVPTNYALPVGGGARLITTSLIPEVALFQTLDLPADTLSVAFDYSWSLTDASQDLVQALLIYGSGAFDFVDLFAAAGVSTLQNTASGSTGAIDIAGFAGTAAVQLDFFIADFDAQVGDNLDIADIVLRTAPAPATPTVWLLALGASLLAAGRLRGRQMLETFGR